MFPVTYQVPCYMRARVIVTINTSTSGVSWTYGLIRTCKRMQAHTHTHTGERILGPGGCRNERVNNACDQVDWPVCSGPQLSLPSKTIVTLTVSIYESKSPVNFVANKISAFPGIKANSSEQNYRFVMLFLLKDSRFCILLKSCHHHKLSNNVLIT